MTERPSGKHMPPKPRTTGTISDGEAYTAQELRLRLGLGAWAWRTLRQRGLKIRKIGKQRLILGADVLRFIESLPAEGDIAEESFGGA